VSTRPVNTRPLRRRLDRIAPHAVAVSFAVSGVVHLVRPEVFTPIVPRMLPAARVLVYVSGVAELVCAAGLMTRRRWAADASTALLLAVWPANLQMALDQRSVVTWIRLPLQLPLIWAARR
jgi:uncharacterized membrane protein